MNWSDAYRSRKLALLCTVLLAVPGMAQRTGRVLLDLSPAGTTTYILDGKYRMSDRQLDLLEGPHRFVFWAPERRMLDTTIVVVPGAQVEARIELRYSEEYVAWRKREDRARLDRTWARYAPPVLMAGSAAFVVVSYIKHQRSYEDLQALVNEYDSSVDPRRIADIKQEAIPAAKDDLRTTRTAMVLSGGVFAASSAALVYFRHRAKIRSSEPFEDKERIRFEGLVWNQDPLQPAFGAQFTIPLGR
jgi:hypothetical protein